MDRFFNPDDIAPDDKWIIEQLPKRTCGKLMLQPSSSELKEAWGIYFEEAWDWVKIRFIVVIGFVLPSLLFGILWGHLKKDVQGGFGVAAVLVAYGTIFMGLFVTDTWKS